MMKKCCLLLLGLLAITSVSCTEKSKINTEEILGLWKLNKTEETTVGYFLFVKTDDPAIIDLYGMDKTGAGKTGYIIQGSKFECHITSTSADGKRVVYAEQAVGEDSETVTDWVANSLVKFELEKDGAAFSYSSRSVEAEEIEEVGIAEAQEVANEDITDSEPEKVFTAVKLTGTKVTEESEVNAAMSKVKSTKPAAE